MPRSDPPVCPKPVLESRSQQPPALVHPGWASAFSWLVQGTTVRGDAHDSFDLGLFGGATVAERVEQHWGVLADETGFSRVVHARQVHGSDVSIHRSGPSGLHLAEPCDAHVTSEPDVLLAVATADCVPVFVVDANRRAIAMVHAGWRGAAAGVLEAALQVLERRCGSDLRDLHLHLGPSICGACYEVGPEVFEALRQPVPMVPTPIDLRGVLAERALRADVPAAQISVSQHCTRCTGSGLFSHRAGDRERQVGFLGVRAAG